MSGDIANALRTLADENRTSLFLGELRTLEQAATLLDAAGGWQPIETAPKDGSRFLAAEWDGQGWIIGPCLWCKTPHVPLYGFHFTEGDPENWEIANPSAWQPLPAPPSLPNKEDRNEPSQD